MAGRTVDAKVSPEAQLRSFIEKCDPRYRQLFRSVRSAVRKRMPAANELVYEYPDSLLVAYSPTERPTDGIVSIAARSTGVSLYFTEGKRLPDPKKRLRGSGRQTRFIPVEAVGDLAHPDVEALLAAAMARAVVPLPSKGRGRLVIRSTAATRRPRRKPTK